MEQLKIALCFSGQPRAWKLALPSIQSFIAEFDTPPDIFMHVWDFNSTSNHVNNVSEGKLHTHSYEDVKGERKFITEVKCSEVLLLGKPLEKELIKE